MKWGIPAFKETPIYRKWCFGPSISFQRFCFGYLWKISRGEIPFSRTILVRSGWWYALKRRWLRNYTRYLTWICLRCLEKVKHILPNGGVWWYTVVESKKITLNKSKKMSPAGTQIWSRRRFQSIDSMYINHTVDGSEIRETPPGTYKKTAVNHGTINYQPQRCRIFSINSSKCTQMVNPCMLLCFWFKLND